MDKYDFSPTRFKRLPSNSLRVVSAVHQKLCRRNEKLMYGLEYYKSYCTFLLYNIFRLAVIDVAGCTLFLCEVPSAGQGVTLPSMQ